MTRVYEQPPRFDTYPVPFKSQDLLVVEDQIQDISEYLEKLRLQLIREMPHFFEGSKTFNPANLADGAGETTTVTVTGADLGDLGFASFSLDLQGIIVTAWVSSAGVVSVRFQNETGGAVDLASGTLRAWSLKPPSQG